MYSFFSGEFLTPLWTGPDPTGTIFTSSRTPAQVTIRPDHLHDANLPTDQRSTTNWFDVSAFGAPAAGRFGTSAKGVIHGPGSQIVSVGLAKNFSLGERARLRLEITGTNFFNTPNYTNPGVNISQLGSVGVITDAGGELDLDAAGPRAFRTGLRLEW